MAQASIPVDLLNPGQVFACLGFLEVAEQLLGDVKGGFDWSDASDVRFHLRTNGESSPFQTVLAFLAGSTVMSLSPRETLSTGKWDISTRQVDDEMIFPIKEPNSPATLPAILVNRIAENKQQEIIIDHWGDATVRDNVKFWAGAAGYPGAALVRDAINLFPDDVEQASGNPFAFRAPQSNSFRFDWRRDYIAIDTGFSPNAHGDITMVGFPMVELLAAIGLTHARPKRIEKLRYQYGVLGMSADSDLVEPLFLRATLGCATFGFPYRTFEMRLSWPGQENQARCITDVIEEIDS